MSQFVLDASFAISWVVEEARTPDALRIYGALSREEVQAIVPALWPDEMANVLLTLERSKKLTTGHVTGWMELFKRLPIHIDPPSVEESFGEVLILALKHGLTVYDAHYLHLALREGATLATKDRHLSKAATKIGVKLVS